MLHVAALWELHAPGYLHSTTTPKPMNIGFADNTLLQLSMLVSDGKSVSPGLLIFRVLYEPPHRYGGDNLRKLLEIGHMSNVANHLQALLSIAKRMEISGKSADLREIKEDGLICKRLPSFYSNQAILTTYEEHILASISNIHKDYPPYTPILEEISPHPPTYTGFGDLPELENPGLCWQWSPEHGQVWEISVGLKDILNKPRLFWMISVQATLNSLSYCDYWTGILLELKGREDLLNGILRVYISLVIDHLLGSITKM
jgi:hypothetical protein